MRAYILGAGASYPIYPLGASLLDEIDKHIVSCGPLINRFDYKNDWPPLRDWLKNNSNPLLKKAYGNRNIEQIFTVLDLAESLRSESLVSILKASKQGIVEVQEAEKAHDSFNDEVSEYRSVRDKLLWAMEDYFLQRNYEDGKSYGSDQWRSLIRFGGILEPGDVIITFNYDSTVERVLLNQGKWSPSDGYGMDLVFQESRYNETPVHLTSSAVRVIHLHGAIGWYSKPVFSPHFNPVKEDGGSIPRSALSAAPLETGIALDPLFLTGMGINNLDASLPQRPPSELQVLLHPSFLKEYGGEYGQNRVFNRLWRMAADALKCATKVVVIGYSLPSADSAAWTLLQTCCDRGRTDVVNPSKSVLMNQYGWLLDFLDRGRNLNFATWLDSIDGN